jgi:MoxR-like ATPase
MPTATTTELLRTYTLYKQHEPKLDQLWPSLSRKRSIPPHCASQSALRQKPPELGVGLVRALVLLLTHGAIERVAFDGSGPFPYWSVTTLSTSGAGRHFLGGGQTAWHVDHAGYLVGVALAVDALTLCAAEPAAAEFLAGWDALLAGLRRVHGSEPPYPAADLALVSARLDEEMMRATDALYFYGRARVEAQAPLALTAVLEEPDAVRPSGAPDDYERYILRRPVAAPASAPARPRVGSAEGPGLTAQLRRLLRRGGAALLVGETGAGKSKLARLAAIEEGRRLVQVTGFPGMTDREFYGEVRPVATATGREYVWVDGPLSEAWRLAQAEVPTTLIIDELARLDPYYQSPLLEALDRISGADLRHIAGVPQPEAIASEGTYRMLRLPTGERLVASTQHLSAVATSNVGDEYVQLQQKFDAALLGRFDAQYTVERLDTQTRAQILARYHGLPDAVARAIAGFEDETTRHTPTHGGLLARALNLRVAISWGLEARAEVEDGARWVDALRTAAESTVIPYCCGRDSQGALEAPAVDALRELLRQHAHGL